MRCHLANKLTWKMGEVLRKHESRESKRVGANEKKEAGRVFVYQGHLVTKKELSTYRRQYSPLQKKTTGEREQWVPERRMRPKGWKGP